MGKGAADRHIADLEATLGTFKGEHMGDKEDRHIAGLEREMYRLRNINDSLRQKLEVSNSLSDRLTRRVAELEKKLVERDVYEAQQILPPEQAALIKHLKTVERCLEEGREEFHGYDIEVRCIFCHRDEGETHQRDCAWLLMQFDRKPEAAMEMVHSHALREHEAWKRRQKPAYTATRIQVEAANNPLSFEIMRERVDASRGALADAARYVGISVLTSPLVPPGVVYAMSPSSFVLPQEARPVAPNLGIGGEEPTEVAPPDDEDVP